MKGQKEKENIVFRVVSETCSKETMEHLLAERKRLLADMAFQKLIELRGNKPVLLGGG